MARSDGYNTRTRQLILDYLINNRQHAVSASNILEHLEHRAQAPTPPLYTVIWTSLPASSAL